MIGDFLMKEKKKIEKINMENGILRFGQRCDWKWVLREIWHCAHLYSIWKDLIFGLCNVVNLFGLSDLIGINLWVLESFI